MEIEEGLKNDIWLLLQAIKKDALVTPKDEYISFEYKGSDVEVADQRRAVKYLIGHNAIKIVRDLYPFPIDMGVVARAYRVKPTGHLIDLLEPTFGIIYNLFSDGVQKEISASELLALADFAATGEGRLSEKKKSKKTTPKKIETQNTDTLPPQLPEKIEPKLVWLNGLSDGNLERFGKVALITFEELEITGINRLTYNKIGSAPYQRAGFGLEEVKKILNKIGAEESGIIHVSNDEIIEKISGKEFAVRADNIMSKQGYLHTFGLTESDLSTFLILRITHLDSAAVLKKIYDHISKKLQRAKSVPPNLASQTSEQKLVCVLEKIREEFTLGVDSSGMVDIPASHFSNCGVDEYQLNRIVGKFQKDGVIKSHIFIDGSEAVYEEEYDYDVYRLWLPENFSYQADLQIMAIGDPIKHAEFIGLQKRISDMRANPEKYQAEAKERAEKRKGATEKMYSEINYSDPIEGDAWSTKWETIKTLWTAYITSGKRMNISLPIKALIYGSSLAQVDGILDGFKEEGCFFDWQKNAGNYEIHLINEKTFSATYKRIHEVYDRFADQSIDPEHLPSDNGQEKINIIKIGALSFNTNTGDFLFGEVVGNLAPSAQEFRFMKTILESKDRQCDYATLVPQTLNGRQDGKAARNDLGVVVRNIKEKFGILPEATRKNPDIFKAIRSHGYRIVFQ